MKTFFELPSYYEGLRARRIKQSGRLWLVRVISEDKQQVRWPYWFVMIRNFDLEKDKASGATSIGVWRFGHKDQAFAKFNELEHLYPPYAKKEPTPAQLAARDRFAKKQKEAKSLGEAQLEGTALGRNG